MNAIESRTICWPPVHDYVARLAAQFGVDLGDRLPYPGTLAWLALPDDSPAKKVALLRCASERVLHLEIYQESRAEASKAVAAAVDWPAISREIHQRSDFYAAKPWLRRRPA